MLSIKTEGLNFLTNSSDLDSPLAVATLAISLTNNTRLKKFVTKVP